MANDGARPEFLGEARAVLSLVARSEKAEESALLELFDRWEYEHLLAVTHGGRGEKLLERWWCGRNDWGVGVVELGAETRSMTATGSSAATSTTTALSGLPVDRLDELPMRLDALGPNQLDSDAVRYVSRVDELLAAVGFARTYDCVMRLIRCARATREPVFVSLPATVSESVVAGFAPLFDTVVAIKSVESEPVAVERTVSPELSVDRALGLVRPARRRALFHALDEAGGSVTLDALVESVASRLDGPLSSQRRRLRISLYQVDVPKLVDAGVATFGRERGVVSLRPAAMQLWPYLHVATEVDGSE